MKELSLFCYLFFIFTLSNIKLVAQTPIKIKDSFTEYNDEDKFRHYLDTISKYTYIDNQIVNYYLDECETLFKKDLKLTSNDKLKYILILISSGLDKHTPLHSFQLVNEFQHLLNDKDVSKELKSQFFYLKAYTSFILEDTKDAQTAFYNMYEEAIINKDTLSIVKASYSLGQIYMDDENYSAAIDHFNKVKKIDKETNLDPSIYCLVNLELSATYISLKDYDKALKVIEESLEYIKLNKIREFKSDFLLLKGEIALDKKDFKTAQYSLDEAISFMEATDSYYMLNNSKIFNAKLLSAQGFNKQALNIYELLLNDENKLSNKKKIEVYEFIHTLCNIEGYKTKAYKYLMLEKELLVKMQKKKKSQETAYLKIKFDSAQKEKENQLLTAKVLQKQTQNKLLYALIILSIIGLLVLIGAYYQKQKFAQKLKLEVQNRTLELEQSNKELNNANKELNNANKELNNANKELDEFNRILSHDLKEPLRSIVGFSGFIRKEVPQHSKVKEYSHFIEKSGRQLHQIIEGVSTFQRINDFADEPAINVNPQKIIEKVIESIKIKYPAKSIKINFTTFPIIFANKSILSLVFQNLIENGILYNQSTISQVHIRYSQRHEKHIFEFQDNGVGIEPEYHQQIFEMFKRLNNRKEFRGPGLGLSICKKMLKKIEGDIKILALEKNEGSLFEISFPIIYDEKSNVFNYLTREKNI